MALKSRMAHRVAKIRNLRREQETASPLVYTKENIVRCSPLLRYERCQTLLRRSIFIVEDYSAKECFLYTYLLLLSCSIIFLLRSMFMASWVRI